MKLSELLRGVAVKSNAAPDAFITSVSYDTRTIKPGAVFFALSGYKTDGHRHIEQAVARGAVAVVCKTAPAEKGPWIVTDDPRAALALASANWFGHPADKLHLIAVTGTNGKTTTTYLLKAMLEAVVEAKVGLVGTNQNMIGDDALPAARTTPESYELHELLRAMADAGCTWAVMEVSSHALVLRRVFGLRFAAGVFTNLTQDHLDFHGTMEAYRAAKGLLFRQTDIAVLNLDDAAGRDWRETLSCPTFVYSERRMEADLTARNIRLLPDGVSFEAVSGDDICRVTLPIPGGFSIYNALGVTACGLALGLPLPAVAQSLAAAKGVRGRVEVVPVPAQFTVLIDYAHTPDALENVLLAVRGFTKGRVIVMFGCGGDRDRSKRPQMGAIATRLADLVVVTSDNPRTENPQDIIDEILAGVEQGSRPAVQPDRAAAIRLALSLAKPGDTVVLAGKGHETYQEINGARRRFDEREEVRGCFDG